MSSSILDLPTWGVHSSVPYLFALSYCSWASQGKNTEVVCHSLLQWTTFCQTSPPWPIRLGWSHMAWLSFIELDKAGPCDQIGYLSVIVVSVCLPSDALSQRLLSYLGFSYLGRGVYLHCCSRKAQLLLLFLDVGQFLSALIHYKPHSWQNLVFPFVNDKNVGNIVFF